jgi:hypothetical protein
LTHKRNFTILTPSKREFLYKRARDKITGFEGIVVARDEWLNGCVRAGIQGEKLKEDGTPSDIQWFDEKQIELIAASTNPRRRKTGGPTPTPKRNPDPSRF